MSTRPYFKPKIGGIEMGSNQETVTPCMSVDLDFKVISHPFSYLFFMTT